MVGLGIIKQSTANTIAVAEAAKAEMARLNPTLPEGMEIEQSYDTSVFVKGAIKEVYKTLGIAIGLVVDDAIVVLENVHRRTEQYGETRLVAAYRGARQVGFAVVATYTDAGEEYDVILEGERDVQRTPASPENLYVRSARGGNLIPLANLARVSDAQKKQENRKDPCNRTPIYLG